MRGETEGPAAFHNRDRWARHSFHSRSVEARKCVATHRHTRMARLSHRAVEDYRTTHGSDCTWRHRIGRVSSRDSVDAWVRLFRQAGFAWLGSRAHRTCMARVDEASRILE